VVVLYVPGLNLALCVLYSLLDAFRTRTSEEDEEE
jgi:hypothetical protein